MKKIRNYIASIMLGILAVLPFCNVAFAYDVSIGGIANNTYYKDSVRPTFYATDGASIVASTLNGSSFPSGSWIGAEGLYVLTVSGKKARQRRRIGQAGWQ